MLTRTPRRPRWRRVACALTAALLLAPASVVAATASDRIDGVVLAEAPELVAAAPDLEMPAGTLVTMDGRELWARSTDEARAMASTTKIMTAVVVLETMSDLDVDVRVPRTAERVGEADVGLKAGQVFTGRQLLEAMLVHSGNDAAMALGTHVAGTEVRFVEMMNAKAQALGLAETHFANPHGLDEPGHHTSARDLATLTRYAMAIPEFRRIVALKTTQLPGGRLLESSNKLLTSFDGAEGVKTGWTDDAGYCLVAAAKRGEIELIAVVLGTENERDRFDQAKELLEWGFAHYAVRQLSSAETSVGAVPVSDYLDISVTAVVQETTAVPVFDLAGEVTTRIDLYSEIEAPVAPGDRVGTLTIMQGDRLLAQVPVVANEAVEPPGFLEGIWIGIVRAWRWVFGGPMMAET